MTPRPGIRLAACAVMLVSFLFQVALLTGIIILIVWAVHHIT